MPQCSLACVYRVYEGFVALMLGLLSLPMCITPLVNWIEYVETRLLCPTLCTSKQLTMAFVSY